MYILGRRSRKIVCGNFRSTNTYGPISMSICFRFKMRFYNRCVTTLLTHHYTPLITLARAQTAALFNLKRSLLNKTTQQIRDKLSIRCVGCWVGVTQVFSFVKYRCGLIRNVCGRSHPNFREPSPHPPQHKYCSMF